jgi:O-antigen/teichoic acid export membrane protein
MLYSDEGIGAIIVLGFVVYIIVQIMKAVVAILTVLIIIGGIVGIAYLGYLIYRWIESNRRWRAYNNYLYGHKRIQIK